VLSTIQCTAHDGNLNLYKMPQFKQEVVDAVSALSKDYDENAYMNFLKTIGTHYVHKLMMGSKYEILYQFEQSNFDALWDAKFDI